MAHYRVHRMIQNLTRDTALAERFRADKQAVCSEFGLSDEESRVIAGGDKQALIALGIHPNLQMKLFGLSRTSGSGGGPLANYFLRLEQLPPFGGD